MLMHRDYGCVNHLRFVPPDPVADVIKEMLDEIDPNRITPVEALMKLSEMTDKLQD